MIRNLGRRKFLLYGSAALGTSVLLKACASAPTDTAESPAAESPAASAASGGTIKVGILHSLSGTMAISEKSVVDSTQLAIEEINSAGGVLGKTIEPIIEDGASDWPTFAEKARKLIEQDQVVVIFGCWTSASRKAVLPVFEEKNHMLFYPVQYEGQECSKNIFYTGAAPNQQIEPSVDWLLENKGKDFYLVGSDYVFPRTANTIIKAQVAAKGGTVAGEDYLPLGNTEVAPIIAKIRSALPNGGVIYNTLNGDSNVAFFKQMQGAGLTPDKYPTMSVSIAEEEVTAIGKEYLLGQYAAWNYFMTVESPENKTYVDAFKAKFGESRVTNDPMESAYISVNIWKQAVEKAGAEGTPTDLEAVRSAAYDQEFAAPQGPIKMFPNHHISKTVRIGEVRDDGLFEIIFETDGPVDPVPWNQYVAETKGFACDWTKTDVDNPGQFKI
jgi:urea transport system substrate-binding protein